MTQQLITFEIADKRLGVDIMAIREIRAWTPPTPIPHAPSFVRGIVNLRGTVLPVVDLSDRLGWDAIAPSPRHVIIVIQIGEHMHGLVVDSVNDIVTIEPSAMQPPPDLGGGASARRLAGLISVEDRMVMVLDLRCMAIDSDAMLADAA
ncbi:chemotaxis protein CheW [Arthrobacter sp. TPD3018]|uniref:chemotaxis protein CheW n=1 Tax=Bacteria TaxID=2 RepID=UPI000D5228B0|nr:MULTISPECIES: chemotaxis protein CheW [Bacteria]PVE59829.1 chemotaxis protein CheW [Sphingomonas sp. TPD3009]PVE61347.1 chemotaxis protein CheW [Arthrobacter sp. TPD3018]PVE85735.1 chemotaxis protein CheW [Sphingomonas melonis]